MSARTAEEMAEIARVKQLSDQIDLVIAGVDRSDAEAALKASLNMLFHFDRDRLATAAAAISGILRAVLVPDAPSWPGAVVLMHIRCTKPAGGGGTAIDLATSLTTSGLDAWTELQAKDPAMIEVITASLWRTLGAHIESFQRQVLERGTIGEVAGHA